MKHSRMQYLLPAVICAIIVFVFSASAAAGVIYVKWNATGTPDGKSWDTAFLKVQEGLDAAASGDEVWVAAGTYVEKLTMKEGTALYGGFVGTESSLDQRDWTANQTILDGNGNSDAVIGSRAIAPGIRVDGFVIRNATYGLWCWSVDARNCTISSRMWGIFACYSPISNPSVSVSVTNCSIASARCLESRGVGSLVVDGCIMSPRDMGVYCSAKSFRLVNNSISGTSGGYLTFGISAGGEGVISGNTIQGMRTGVEFSYRSGSVTIQGNTIRGNTDSGIWCQNASVQIIGNLIENNTTNRSGGGIRCDSTSSLLIKDNVIRGNQAGTQDCDSGGGGIYCKSC